MNGIIIVGAIILLNLGRYQLYTTIANYCAVPLRERLSLGNGHFCDVSNELPIMPNGIGLYTLSRSWQLIRTIRVETLQLRNFPRRAQAAIATDGQQVERRQL